MDPGAGVRWKLYLEAARAWIPIVISVCAISFTIYQGMLSRRHTKLSVQPRVDWRIEEDAVGGTLALSLVNVGFGSRPTRAHAAEDQTEAVVDYRRLGASARYCSFYEDCWDLPPT